MGQVFEVKHFFLGSVSNKRSFYIGNFFLISLDINLGKSGVFKLKIFLNDRTKGVCQKSNPPSDCSWHLQHVLQITLSKLIKKIALSWLRYLFTLITALQRQVIVSTNPICRSSYPAKKQLLKLSLKVNVTVLDFQNFLSRDDAIERS